MRSLVIALAALLLGVLIYRNTISASQKFVDDQDLEFLNAWRNRSLEFKLWNHKGHLRACYATLVEIMEEQEVLNSSLENSLYERMKKFILNFNEKHKEKLSTGFHETLTAFWIKTTLQRFCQFHKRQAGKGNTNFEAFYQQFESALKFQVVFDFYTKDYLFSKDAKAAFVDPDIKPLETVSKFCE